MWINGIRLSIWERSRCNEIWTGSLLGTREPRPLGWQGYDAGLPAAQGSSNSGKASSTSRFEGWLKVRLPGETEWRRVWCVVHRGSNVPTRANALNGDTSGTPATTPAEEKKSRRSSLLSFGVKKEKKDEISLEDVPGSGAVSTLLFYDHKPTKKDQPVCIAQHVYYASAVFPESEQLMEHSTLFKIEGTFLSPHDKYTAAGWGAGGRGDKQGFALVMLEEGNYRDMLYWIVGISDAFKVSFADVLATECSAHTHPSPALRSSSQFFVRPARPQLALLCAPHRSAPRPPIPRPRACVYRPSPASPFPLTRLRTVVDNLKIDESRPRAVRATFHSTPSLTASTAFRC